MKPSQLISRDNIDDAYDKIYEKLKIATDTLTAIANTPFDIDGYSSAKEAANWMNVAANKALDACT